MPKLKRPVVVGPNEVAQRQCQFAIRSVERAVIMAQLHGARGARDALRRLGELGDQARHLAEKR
jgi:hypothetical protein